MLSAQARKKIEALKTEYETNLSALIPALHVAQGDQGWLSPEIQAEVATLLEITPQAVREVVTFYTMFHQKPVGKFLLQVCRNLSCCLHGGHRLQRQIEERLGIQDGETTQDGRFTLMSVECSVPADGAGPHGERPLPRKRHAAGDRPPPHGAEVAAWTPPR